MRSWKLAEQIEATASEMLHTLDLVAGQCKGERSGSLLDEAMREKVCRVMEGRR